MTVATNRVPRLGAVLAAALLLLSGCAANRYRAPITGFQTAAGTAIASARQYYLESNKAERDHYIDDRAATKDAIDSKQLETIRRSFSAEDIGARMEALGALGDYTALLLKLATSDAPAEAAKQVGAVEASVATFADRAAKLCDDAGCVGENKEFKAAASNVAAVVSPILKGLLAQKIQRGLDKSVQTAEKPIADLIDAIRHDMANLQERRRQAISDLWSLAVRRYNDEQKKTSPDFDRLAALAERVKALSDKQDQLVNANPDRALAAMNRAHQALVQFSRHDKSPSNLSDLADAVQAFANEAALAGRALRALTGI
jgi:methyl-accepting chemotaxis protein